MSNEFSGGASPTGAGSESPLAMATFQPRQQLEGSLRCLKPRNYASLGSAEEVQPLLFVFEGLRLLLPLIFSLNILPGPLGTSDSIFGFKQACIISTTTADMESQSATWVKAHRSGENNHVCLPEICSNISCGSI